MKKVTIRMVAAKAGVSHATVSRVLNNKSNVHHTTRDHVIQIAQEMGYQYGLACDRKNIAVIIPQRYKSGYLNQILLNLHDDIRKQGYRTELIFPEDIELLNDNIIAGGISLSLESWHLEWSEAQSIPLVQINWHSSPIKGVYSVYSDGVQGMALAVDYLQKKGHSKIAYLADVPRERDKTLSSHRYNGFISAMNKVCAENPEEHMFFGARLEAPNLKNFIEKGYTALLCVGEETGIQVARQISRQGIKVPEELSLLTMENPLVSETFQPPQTTLSQDFSKLSFHAVELLKLRINREPIPGDIRVPYQLIERDSVSDINT